MKSAISNQRSEIASLVPRLLGGILVFFLALAVTLRPLLPGHRDEANLWVAMCVFVAALAWLVRAALGERLTLQRTGLGIPMVVLLAIAACSALRSPHPSASLATLLEWLSYAAAFALLVGVTSGGDEASRGFFLRLLWASAFVTCLYGLLQQYVNLPAAKRMIESDAPRVMAELRMGPQHIGDLMARATGRIFSTFLVSNSFAGFLALVVPGFLGYVLDRLRGEARGQLFLWTGGLWMACALTCLLLTYSKGGWVAFGVGMVAFAAMLGKELLVRRARLVLGVAAAAIVAFGLLLAVKAVPVQIFRDLFTSRDVRLGYWQGALGMARDHPLGGVGLGTFGDHYPLYRPLMAHPAQDAHNDYLQVLAELGVPGLAAFLWLWGAYLRNAFRRTTDYGPRTTDHGLRTTDHGLRTTDHGLRTTDHGLRTMAYPAAVVAFILTTIVMAPFRLEGWWDETPEAQELRAWLDRALVVGFLACWALFFAALGRIDAPGELCRKGLACGVLAFLVHCAMDFDYQEPGVAFTAWVVAGLSVRPLRAAFAPRLRPAPAIAIVACGLVAMATFQVGLWRASRAGTERDIAASLLADAARSRSPIERAELLHKARLRYEAAVSAYPLDETLWAEYGDLLVSLLVPPDIGGEPGAGGPNSFQLRVRIETPNQVEDFARAVEAYGRAGALSRRWAAPHAHLGRLYQAAAAPDAGPRAAEALAPKVDAAIARRGRPGPNLRYLPALVAFEEALKRDPNNPAPMLLVGEAFEKLGDPEAARAFAARALSIHELLAAAHPGHKLCLTPGQAARARALAGPTNP